MDPQQRILLELSWGVLKMQVIQQKHCQAVRQGFLLVPVDLITTDFLIRS